MDWRLRILRGTLYSQLPLMAPLRRVKRRLRPPRGESPNTRFAIQDGLRQLDCLRRAGVAPGGTVLEMGTGWLPVIPVLFRMAGYERVILTDLERLMDAATIRIALDAVRRRLPEVAASLGLSIAEATARLEAPFEPEYRAPWTPGDGAVRNVDLLISRCVFEHVPPRPLEECLEAFRAVVRPGGFMCHVVDNSDHWQHIHPPRSRIQFLTWRRGGVVERFARLNHFAYNNRLRHSDYLAMFRRTGWEVILEEGEVDEQALRDAARLPLVPPYRDYDRKDLAILSSVFVTRRPAAAKVRAEGELVAALA